MNQTALSRFFFTIILISGMVISMHCKKDDPKSPLDPVVATDSVFSISQNAALCLGHATADTSDPIIDRGFCWSTGNSPTTADSKISIGAGNGFFTGSISGLTTNTTYSVRAYATNNHGTVYGNTLTFKTEKEGVIHIDAVSIPAGSFIMGSPDNASYHGANETEHPVILTAFRMSKYEITNAQFAEFLNTKKVGSNGKYPEDITPNYIVIYASSSPHDWGLHYSENKWVPVSGFENHPVTCVTWNGANDFAQYVGGTLPTEAQWEYACRANTSTAFNTGDCLSNEQANYHWSQPADGCVNSITTSPDQPVEVGSFPPNAWGLYNMHANVWEWCSDWYGEYPVGVETNPTGPATGDKRVLRGGSYGLGARFCNSVIRGGSYPATPMAMYADGFRVVLP